MASRQNQGLQIALIFFVVTTILLSVVVYFTAVSASEKISALEAKNEELSAMRAQKDAYSTLSNLLMAWVGDGEWSREQWEKEYEQLVAKTDANVAPAVDKAKQYYEYYSGDMLNFGADNSDPEGWRTLPTYLLTTIKSKNTEIELLNGRVEEAQADAKQAEETKVAALAKADEQIAALENEKEQLRVAFDSTARRLEDEQSEALAQANEARREQQADLKSFTQEVAAKTDEIATLETSVSQLATQVDEYEREEFDVADGQITRINPRLGLAWINLGTEDNLPRNAVFSVYSADSSSFKPDGKKGELRIKRILGPHSAEAEILVDDLQKTMLVGDSVWTPTWKPGRVTKYALTGSLDFDGDNVVSALDIKRLKTLIEQNGGEVVAEVDPTSGSLSGEVTALTNFLIVGDGANLEDPSMSTKVADADSQLREQAQANGVQLLDVQQLLDNFGFRDEKTIERIGVGGGDFAPRRPPARPSEDSAF